MTKDEAKAQLKRMTEILAEHDMRIYISGCGCCGSPAIRFEHDGEMVVFDNDDKSGIFYGNDFGEPNDPLCVDMFEETILDTQSALDTSE